MGLRVMIERPSKLRLAVVPSQRCAGTRRKDFTLDKYLRGAFSVFRGNEEDDIEVVVEFDAWATDVLRGRRWHWSQSTIELPGGQMRMGLRLSSIEEVERWLLSWGTHATVIAPLALADRVEKIAMELQRRYAEFRKKAEEGAMGKG